MAVDQLSVLRDRHVYAGSAFGIDQFDCLRHCVGIFAAMLHGFEAQAGAVHMRVLRAFVRRHLRKSTGELHQKVLAGARSTLGFKHGVGGFIINDGIALSSNAASI
jgi:hypothetical protein